MAGFAPADGAAFRANLAVTLARLTSSLAGVVSGRIWVAYSGGLDSHALLHALAVQGVEQLHAVHIDHGLHAASSAWDEHCRARCAELAVPYVSRAVDATARAGQSPEDSARRARYAAIADLLSDGDILLTAQHRDDQLETFLLQMLRGAGPKGLAAMPEVARMGAGWLLRPFLEVDRETIHAYASGQGLVWLDDPSNSDTRFDRNYLRHAVIPALRNRWPAVARTVARSARLAARAASAIERQARADLEEMAPADAGTLPIAPLQRMGDVRAREVLRLWLLNAGVPVQAEALIERVLTELMVARVDAEPVIPVGEGTLRRHRGHIHLVPQLPEISDWSLSWADPSQALVLPAGLGRLVWDDPPQVSPLRVHARRGGERYREIGGSRPTRAMKDVLREAGLPPWLRPLLPLVSELHGPVIGVPGVSPGLIWEAPDGLLTHRSMT
ncbi:MAG: tRNA lysidine(34) synthetase TilS [Chromatiales bacterium]|nr:tRNA lysidine(34) synthetase TilS [Gammaproteobacteria bacterium]MCP5352825.1 tRNA lysidine(34) synthetase TilS [Chromatiales bacterium]